MNHRHQRTAAFHSTQAPAIDVTLVRARLLGERSDVVARIEAVQHGTMLDDRDGDGVPMGDPERDRALAVLLADHLDQIEQALVRLDDGSYGTCAGCSCAIPPRRLDVLPLATLCVSCQAASEHHPVHRR